MKTEMNIARLLGTAQLAVFAASMISERLLAGAVGSGGVSDILVSVSANQTRMRISNVIALANCLAIVVLGALFYAVFRAEYKIISLVALGCFLAEAITLAVSKLGAFALIPLSKEFVAAGTPGASRFQTLGNLLYHGIDRTGYDIHMLFFCIGAALWYYLLVSSGSVPRALAVWGLAAVCLLTIPVLLVLYDRDSASAAMIAGLPYLPYELVLGLWLLIKGFS